MPISHILFFRHLALTDLHTLAATGMELTALRRVGRGRNTSLQNNTIHLSLRIRNGNRGEQSLGIGVERIVKDILRISKLHQISQIHYTNRIRNMLYHG